MEKKKGQKKASQKKKSKQVRMKERKTTKIERTERKEEQKIKERKQERSSLLVKYSGAKRKFQFWRVTFPIYLSSLHLVSLSDLQKPVQKRA